MEKFKNGLLKENLKREVCVQITFYGSVTSFTGNDDDDDGDHPVSC